MGAAGDQDFGLRAAEYLQHMQGLAAELERGMDSIARNALADFEESITNQQAAVAHLTELAKGFGFPVPGNLADDPPFVNPEMAARIQAASRELHMLNKRYSALLSHSSRSVAQMISLFTSLKGYYRQTSASNHQTWSCQA